MKQRGVTTDNMNACRETRHEHDRTILTSLTSHVCMKQRNKACMHENLQREHEEQAFRRGWTSYCGSRGGGLGICGSRGGGALDLLWSRRRYLCAAEPAEVLQAEPAFGRAQQSRLYRRRQPSAASGAGGGTSGNQRNSKRTWSSRGLTMNKITRINKTQTSRGALQHRNPACM